MLVRWWFRLDDLCEKEIKAGDASIDVSAGYVTRATRLMIRHRHLYLLLYYTVRSRLVQRVEIITNNDASCSHHALLPGDQLSLLAATRALSSR